jgi:hypothetical protein
MSNGPFSTIDPNSLPIIGGRKFVCAAGHVQVATVPFMIGFSPQLNSGPVCPVCIFKYLSDNFAVKELAEEPQIASE